MQNQQNFKKLPDELREKLRAPFPPEAYDSVDSKSYLTTIKAMYVTERLNDVFGLCGWFVESDVIREDSFGVVLYGRIFFPEYGTYTPYQYGGKAKLNKQSWDDTYKGAMTSLVSKCASLIEIGIDVFKGLVDPPKNGNSRNENGQAGKVGFNWVWDLPEDKFTPKLLIDRMWDMKIRETKGGKKYVLITDKEGNKALAIVLNKKKEKVCSEYLLLANAPQNQKP